MLKIKDNVDLKELKKFGFRKNSVNNKTYIKQNGEKFFESHIVISTDRSRMLYITVDNGYSWLPIDNALFDIIQAGLIEKVN